jgi:hypothetical protein
MKKYRFCIIVFVLFLNFANCRKEGKIISAHGKLKDLTGMVDGCWWIIETDTHERFEPINFDDFNITFKNDAPVTFSYVELPSASVCMVGKTIELKTLTADQ